MYMLIMIMHGSIIEEDIVIRETGVDLKKKLFPISLREKYKLSSKVIPWIINEFLNVICYHKADFSQIRNQYLTNSHSNEQEYKRLTELIEVKYDVENAFLNLD